MKKIIMALAFIAFTIGNAAIAGEKEIDKRIRQSFEKEFAGAIDVKWYTHDEYTQVDFSFNGVQLMVYYNNNGETLALVRNIGFSSLPLLLQFDLKRNYKDYWITQIRELTNRGGTHYYLILENADKTIKLRSFGSNEWDLMGKEAKK